MPSLRPALGSLAVAAIAAFIGGCGNDEGPDDASPALGEPLTRPEFLREADLICYSTEARIEAAADDLVTAPGEPDPAEVTRVARSVVIPALETEVRAIRALGAPPGDEQRVAAILDATERGIAAIEREPRRLLDGAPRELRRAGRLARAYGSAQCGFR